MVIFLADQSWQSSGSSGLQTLTSQRERRAKVAQSGRQEVFMLFAAMENKVEQPGAKVILNNDF